MIQDYINELYHDESCLKQKRNNQYMNRTYIDNNLNIKTADGKQIGNHNG